MLKRVDLMREPSAGQRSNTHESSIDFEDNGKQEIHKSHYTHQNYDSRHSINNSYSKDDSMIELYDQN